MNFKWAGSIILVTILKWARSEPNIFFLAVVLFRCLYISSTVDVLYANKLKAEGVITDNDIKGWQKEYMDTLNEHFNLAKKVTKLSIMDWVDTPWTGFFEATDPNKVISNLGIWITCLYHCRRLLQTHMCVLAKTNGRFSPTVVLLAIARLHPKFALWKPATAITEKRVYLFSISF